MKLPSFKTVTEHAGLSLKRFPLPLLIAFVGTGVAIYAIDFIDDFSPVLQQILCACFVGLPLMLGCNLFAERLQSKGQKIAVILTGVILILLYGIFLAPSSSDPNRSEIVTFFVLCICMHFWVATAAYINKKERYGFWRFNQELFIRIVLSVIFSGVLFGGLALAIGSLDQLFNFDIDEMIYIRLWLFIAGVFNTWFFLAGIPHNYDDVNTEMSFPKPLKVFVQYILIPLAIVYMLILYAYGIKIVAEWSLPKGWVSWLIMSYSLLGILAILLVYPLRESAQHGWVRLFAKFFFIAIMPLVILLFVAINARVSDYGITEPRYYLLTLGCWLAIMALYFTFSKQKNIKIIPITLLVFGLLSLFGPWNVFNVSENSQKNRLVKIFTQYKMMGDEQLNKPEKEIRKEDAKQIRAVIGFLVDNNHHKALSDIYHTDVKALHDSLMDKDDRWVAHNNLIDTLYVLAYLDKEFSYSRSRYFRVAVNDQTYDLAGYTQIHKIGHIYLYRNRKEGDSFKIHTGSHIQLKYSPDEKTITLFTDEEEVSKIELQPLADELLKMDDSDIVPAQKMIVEGTGKLKVKLLLYALNLDGEDDIRSVEADLLIE